MSNLPPGCTVNDVSDPEPLPWWRRPYPLPDDEDEDAGEAAAEEAERRQRDEQ